MILHLGAFGTHISHSRPIWHSATPRACPYKLNGCVKDTWRAICHIASIVGDYLTTNMVNIWSLHAACIPSPNGVSSVSRFIAEPDNLAFSALVAGNI